MTLESLLISQNLSENPEGWENINFIPVPNFDEQNTFADDFFWISKSEKPAGYGHICADPTNLKVIQILVSLCLNSQTFSSQFLF